MPELGERFEALSRTYVPDLWSEIEGREPRNPFGPSSARRVAVAVVAFVVAIAGLGIAAVTFGGSEKARVPVAPADGVANGQILYRVGGEGGSTWYSVMPDGSSRQVVFDDDQKPWLAQIAWSPDGTRIAYQNPIVDERGIFVANADGSDAVRLTEGANDAWPSWSPDGTRILFSSTRYDPSIPPCEPAGLDATCPTDIYAVEVDGSNVRRLTTDPVAEYRATWSPTGERIAFERNTQDPPLMRPAIFTMNPDGTDIRQVSSGDGGSDFWPNWSPDGERLAFASIRYEDWGIWVVDADGSNERLILGGTGAGYVDNPVWSPDGSLIAFVGNLSVDDYSPEDALYVMGPDGTDVTPIADEPSIGVAGDIAWQPIPAPPGTAEPTPSIPPSTAEVVDTFAVGQDVRSVVYGEGSVWVAVSDNDGGFGGRIVRIDPETHEVEAEIPVETIPTWEVGGGAMVVADGSLWVAGSIEAPGAFDDPGGGADAALVRIDTSTNEVVETFALGGTHGADLTFLNGEPWVLLFGDESVDNRMEVVRLDPTTGDVLDRVPLQAGWAHTIATAGGRLVVYEGGDQGVNVGGHLTSIDPRTGGLTRAEIPSRYFEGGPVVWRGEVWAAAEDGFARFDPVTAEVIEGSPELDPSRYASCCGFVEADDRGIWFIGFDGRTGGDARRLDVFDPSTGEVTELVTLEDGSPVAMAVAPESVWVLNYDGTLTHVALG